MSCRARLFDGSASSQLPELSGQIIGNDTEQYRLSKVIGRGSWGIVYLAHSLTNEMKTYAVKCIANNEGISDTQLEANAKELEYHERCSTLIPGVLKIHTMLQDNYRGVAFIISEYCDGGDLLDMVLNKKFVDNDALIRSAFCQILDTVEAMHGMGIYHRDLKPENVLCKDNGQTFVLADFGFATETEYSREFGMGSEPFMSPEVLGGLNGERTPYNARQSDVWALGIILMNLICGCLPWSRACVDDRDFLTFVLHDSDFFYNNFPISVEVNDIFKSIFTISAEARATIPEIRCSILALRTFFDHSNFGPSRSTSRGINGTETDSTGSTLSDRANEALRALQLNELADIEKQIATRIRVAQLYASIGESLPNDYTTLQHFAPHASDPSSSVWFSPITRPTLRVTNPDILDEDDMSDFNDHLLDEYLPGLSDEEELDITDSDFEGPITPEQAPIDNAHAATEIEDIEHIEEIDLGTSPIGAGTEMRFPPTTRMNKGLKALVTGAEVKSRPNGTLTADGPCYIKATGASQAQLRKAHVAVWTPGWIS